jgi:hypothetical protein
MIIDTGAPVTQIFKAQDIRKDYSILPTTDRWAMLLGADAVNIPVKGLNYVQFELGDLKVGSPTVTFTFHTELLQRFRKKEGGCIGILGLDIIKQCDFVWLSAGVILMPSQAAKKVW